MDLNAAATLQRLYLAAKSDRWKIARGLPAVLWGLSRGIDIGASLAPYLDTAFIPISRDSGQFLFQTALAARARNIVEFGTSYGVSTIYLAAAARETNGHVSGSEIEPAKQAKALTHLQEAGLQDLVDIRLGDALQTLADAPDGVDFSLLDGWKDLYLPMLDLLCPKLAPGAIVLADNIHTFRRALRPYVNRMQAPDSGFFSVTVPIGEGMEFSIPRPAVRLSSERAIIPSGHGPALAFLLWLSALPPVGPLLIGLILLVSAPNASAENSVTCAAI